MKKISLAFFLLFFIAAQLPSHTYSATTTSKKTAKKKSAKKSAKSSKKSSTADGAEPTTLSPAAVDGPTVAQQITAYNYAYALFADKRFDKAKEIFKKLALVSTRPDLNANSLYYYAQCSFRTEDFNGCVKGFNILAKKWPHAEAVQKGFVTRFSTFVIDQVSKLQTHWDYFRYSDGAKDEAGNLIWKESIPPGFKIKRINFKLGFGLYRALYRLNPNSPETLAAKEKLETMINSPIEMLWVDEKACPTPYGHAADFHTYFSTLEKKAFSKFICKRMFYDWETEKFYLFLDMHDDVRNLRPRYVAKTKKPTDNPGGASAPPVPAPGTADASLKSDPNEPFLPGEQDPTIILTLSKLFKAAGYNPYTDQYDNVVDSAESDLNL